MAIHIRRLSMGTFIFWSSIGVSAASLGALIAITVTLGTDSAHTSTPLLGVLIAAAALNVLALIAIFAAALFFLLRTGRKLQIIFCTLSAPFVVAAAITAIYSLACAWNVKRDAFKKHDDVAETTLVIAEAGFAVWAISLLAQILLYAIVLWPHNAGNGALPADELATRLQHVQATKRSLSVRMTAFSSPRQSPGEQTRAETIESHFSSPSLSPRASFRRSVSHAIRPMTSKTRLLFRASMTSPESPSLYSGRDASMDGTRTENEFHGWDTTGGLEGQTVDLIITRPSTRRTRLEPIPGSRPASPAKRLDGPFEESSGAADMAPLESPMASPILSRSGSAFTRPRALSRPHSSNSQHESHIHPLFRSESPNPPPLASPGTIITASPLAGQIVSSEQQYFSPPRRLQSTHGSRAGSPSPLSPARSRQSSFRSTNLQQSSPIEPISPSALSWSAGKGV